MRGEEASPRDVREPRGVGVARARLVQSALARLWKQLRTPLLAGAAVLVVLGLPPLGEAASYVPPPIPSIPPDPTLGFPGYPGYGAAPFETNDYSTNESCQEALNAEINALSQEIANVPSATTPDQFQAATAAVTQIQTEVVALGDLRPACLLLPSGPSKVTASRVPWKASRKAKETSPLTAVCAGYSACSVQGQAILHALGKFPHILSGSAADSGSIVFGRGSFSLGAGKSPEFRITISSNGRKLLGHLNQIKIRISITATYPGDHVRVTSQQVRVLKVKP